MKIYIRRVTSILGVWFDLGHMRQGIFYSITHPILVDQNIIENIQREGHEIMDYDFEVKEMVASN